MPLVFNDDLTFSVNVKLQLPAGWKDLKSEEVLGRVEDPDATWPEMADDEWFEPKFTVSIEGETDPEWNRQEWLDWCVFVEGVDQTEENPSGEVLIVEEEANLMLNERMMDAIKQISDDYTRHLADVRYDRLPVEEAPAE
jgi:hypothetical protein